MSSYTSYLSNILTHTTSRYNSLRKILLSNEDDGDTEDDSHISRVLRAYYTEKGRPYPPWLPQDPNDRRSKPTQPLQQNNSYVGNRNPYNNVQQAGIASTRGSGSLNDLWDAPSAAPVPAQPQSLRAGRRLPVGARQSPADQLSVAQARPLPSQRAGSYQNTQPQGLGSLGQNGYGMDRAPSPGGTAQERLKAKLWGRGGSSTSVTSVASAAGNPYDQGVDAGSSYNTGRQQQRYGRPG